MSDDTVYCNDGIMFLSAEKQMFFGFFVNKR